MACRMATSKQKKRLINSIDSDQCRPGKKTKFHSSNCLVSLNPHIGLKWDQHLRRVVPEKEQVGLLWSDLAPFIERPKHHSGLANVTYISPETFSFENLRDMLSYEVWTTCLTEDERKFLIQFLPNDTDVEESVHSLLTGENLHFGNPFLTWSSSLCYGDIHPDAVLNNEKHIKAAEKAHRVELYNYHSNMVETLKKWRKRWLSCGDTENLFRLCLLKLRFFWVILHILINQGFLFLSKVENFIYHLFHVDHIVKFSIFSFTYAPRNEFAPFSFIFASAETECY